MLIPLAIELCFVVHDMSTLIRMSTEHGESTVTAVMVAIHASVYTVVTLISSKLLYKQASQISSLRPKVQFSAPPDVILFDVKVSELKASEELACENCSLFTKFQFGDDYNDCFLAAKCTSNGIWHFGVSVLVRDDTAFESYGFKLRAEYSDLMEHSFHAFADNGIFDCSHAIVPMLII